MEFGLDRGCGIPFYLNGRLTGWICTSLNGTFSILLAGAAVYDFFETYRFANEMSAKLELMSWFGE